MVDGVFGPGTECFGQKFVFRSVAFMMHSRISFGAPSQSTVDIDMVLELAKLKPVEFPC